MTPHAVFNEECLDYGINVDDVESTLLFPDDQLEYIIHNRLSLKAFNRSDKKRTHLIVGDSFGDSIGFCYWMPSDIAEQRITLHEKHLLFLSRFACTINIEGQEDFYFEELHLESANGSNSDFMNVIDNEFGYIPTRKRWHYDPNQSLIRYCFCINFNTYKTWLDVETIKVSVSTDRHAFFTKLNNYVRWNGSSKFKVMKPVRRDGLAIIPRQVPTTFETIDVISKHAEFMKYWIKYDSELGEGEEITYTAESSDEACIFCGSSDLNREHIFPVWMRKYFPNELIKSLVAKQNINGGLDLMEGPNEDLYGITFNRICQTCNREWMGDLEQIAKKLLVNDDVFKTDITHVLPLNYNESFQLSRWILLKALTFCEKSAVSTHMLPKTVREDLKAGKIDSNFLIEVREEVVEFGFQFTPLVRFNPKKLKIKSASIDLNSLADELFVVGFQVGKFLFRVSYFQDTPKLYRMAKYPPAHVLFPERKIMPFFQKEGEEKKWEDLPLTVKPIAFPDNIGLTDYL